MTHAPPPIPESITDLPAPSALRWTESVLLLPIRVVLGGLFVFAAWLKLSDPHSFAESIKAFEILRADHQIVTFAYIIPWAEMLCGIALVCGYWSRGAALLLALQIAVFTAGIASVIARGMELSCGCCGDYEWPCQSPIGTCHLIRNLSLLAAAALIAWRGGGVISSDSGLLRGAQKRAVARQLAHRPANRPAR